MTLNPTQRLISEQTETADLQVGVPASSWLSVMAQWTRAGGDPLNAAGPGVIIA